MATDDLAGRRIGGFELIEPIGAGAYASVWRARQLRLDRDVAIKVLDPLLARNPDAARRFEREGRAAAALDHPNIVPVYEAGEADGIVYLAMRLVDGQTLEDRLEQGPPLELSEVIALLRPVAAALDHAHERDLVHRDVKPSNILLGPSTVWLADFGIAATTRDIGRYTTGSIGTADYMAPEQASGGEIDRRADVYSLACTAWHALNGSPPFSGPDLVATLMAHATEPIPATGSTELDAVFAKGLAKQPDQRFATASAFVTALSSVGPTEAKVLATPAARVTGAPTAQPKKSHRKVYLLLLATLLALAAGATAALYSGSGSEAPTTTLPAVIQTPLPATTTAPPPATTNAEQPATNEATQQALVQGGRVNIGVDLPLNDLNPHRDLEVQALVSRHVLPTLVVVEEDFTITPSLAAELPTLVSSDPQVVSWRLRSDAVWDDGTPITASDVQRTWQYITNPESESIGTAFYDRISEFTIQDDQNFTITFAEPVAPYSLLFSTNHPIIKADGLNSYLASGGAVGEFLKDLTSMTFSGGPYRVSGFDVGERLTLVTNDMWWGTAPNLEQINARRYNNSAELLDALEAKDVDLVYLLNPGATDGQKARQIPGNEVVAGRADITLQLEMNTNSPALSDKLVRQAIAAGLNRTDLVETAVVLVTGEVAEPWNSLVFLPEDANNEDPFSRWTGDKLAAETLLQEAGWLPVEGQDIRFKDGAELRLTLLHSSSVRESLSLQIASIAIFNQLREFGINVEVLPLDSAEVLRRELSGDYDLLIKPILTISDPIASVLRYSAERCPSAITRDGCDAELGVNYRNYNNPEATILLEGTETSFETEVRMEMFAQADSLLAEDVPSLPLYGLPAIVAYRDDMVGVSTSALRGGPLVRLDEWALLAPTR